MKFLCYNLKFFLYRYIIKIDEKNPPQEVCMSIKRTVKYEGELDRSILAYVMSMPGGERVIDCIQCGTCSGVCPVSIYMDYTPRRIVGFIREGFKEEALSSFTIWLCASCYSCTVACPQEVKITEIMYALKRKAIQERKYPRSFPVPVLAREFYKMVKRDGRTTEALLVLKLILKTGIMKAFSYAPLGLNLLKKGRLSFKRERIKGVAHVEKLLKAAEEVSK